MVEYFNYVRRKQAIYPTKLIESQSGYYSNIVSCQEKLNYAEDSLKNIQESIEYAKKLLADKF